MADATAVIAGRNFKIYSSPWDATNVIPDNTTGYGIAWGTPSGQAAPWVDRGYTNGGLKLAMNVQRGEIRVDQEFDPIYLPVTSRTLKLSTELSEMTPANLQLASGLGDLTNTPSDVSTLGNDDLDITSDVTDDFNSWGFDIRQPNGLPYRVVVYKGLATGSPEPTFTADNAATTALEITALVDSSTDPSRVAKIRDVLPLAGA